MAENFKLEKPVYDWLLKIGPGGIRTHDQGIMSPLVSKKYKKFQKD